jgi:hypothetical protein
VANRDTLVVPGYGWLDLKRTKTLWDSVFTGQKALEQRNDWIDRPSVGIPYLYVATGLMLSQVLQATGDTAAATRILGDSRRIAQSVRLDDIVAELQQQQQPTGPAQNPLLTPTDTTQGQPLKR